MDVFKPEPISGDDGYCFACGKQNPHGLHMKIERGDNLAFCRIALPRHCQGWEGISHGGILAVMLDEIMAAVVIEEMGNAVTTGMELRYRAPVHVGSEVEVRGWVETKGSRMALAKGEILDAASGKVLTEASAKFLLRGGKKPD